MGSPEMQQYSIADRYVIFHQILMLPKLSQKK